MALSSSSQPKIPILNGKDDYDFWAVKMWTLLCSHGIWNYVK